MSKKRQQRFDPSSVKAALERFGVQVWRTGEESVDGVAGIGIRAAGTSAQWQAVLAKPDKLDMAPIRSMGPSPLDEDIPDDKEAAYDKGYQDALTDVLAYLEARV